MRRKFTPHIQWYQRLDPDRSDSGQLSIQSVLHRRFCIYAACVLWLFVYAGRYNGLPTSHVPGWAKKCPCCIRALRRRNLYQWLLRLHCRLWSRTHRQHHLGCCRGFLGADQVRISCNPQIHSLHNHCVFPTRIAPVLCRLSARNRTHSVDIDAESKRGRRREHSPKAFWKMKRYKMKQNHFLHITIIVLICMLCLLAVTGCGSSQHGVCYSCGACTTSACFNSCNFALKGCSACIDCTGCGQFCDGCGAFLRN